MTAAPDHLQFFKNITCLSIYDWYLMQFICQKNVTVYVEGKR